MSHVIVPQVESGGQRVVWVMDQEARETLKLILLELRKMNVHLAVITGERVDEAEADPGNKE